MVFPIRSYSYLECDKNMELINQHTKVETVQAWLDEFSGARTKPSPFKTIEVDQSLIRQWNEFLVPSFKAKCPFAVKPIREILCEAIHPQYIAFRANYNGPFETCVDRTTAIIPTIDNLTGTQELVLPDRKYIDFFAN
ncbi:hypothetical protein HUJ04_008284 [Dendroctonus ponderosae]|nr:hypothetical protein HUJ04_008284 [Dendroctonus ponderosae]KAH1008149.1 hypothetical protein HUJ05_008730 [Dendroctonus ponderosae]